MDYSFENNGAWEIAGTGAAITKDDPKTGEKSVHFYNDNAFSFTLTQTVTASEAGLYNASIFIQGGAGTGGNADERIYLSAVNSEGTEYISDNITLAGWKTWKQPVVAGIAAAAGDQITITLHVKAYGGSWGTIDDACLFLDGGFTKASSMQ